MVWFAVIEACGIFLYLFLRLFGSAKYEIYSQLSLTDILPYETAKIVVIFGTQFALIAYAFLRWYREEYKIQEGLILHSRGVFIRRNESIAVGASDTISVYTGLLGKIFHYGNIRVQSGEKIFTLKTISRPELIVKAIYDGPMAAKFTTDQDIEKLLTLEENDRLEFKSSLRYDYKVGNVSRELEKAALKTVAAFLNSKGGYLVVGVSDKRDILGIEHDYQSLQRKDRDGFENHFTQAFNAAIGPGFRDLVKLNFFDRHGGEVCIIEVLPSSRPVYFKSDNSEHFYIRTGNITSSLTLSQMESYFRFRWPKL